MTLQEGLVHTLLGLGTWTIVIDHDYVGDNKSFSPVSYVGEISIPRVNISEDPEMPDDLKQKLGITRDVQPDTVFAWDDNSGGDKEKANYIAARRCFALQHTYAYLERTAKQLQFRKLQNGDFVLCGDAEVERKLKELEEREIALKAHDEEIKAAEEEIKNKMRGFQIAFGKYLDDSDDSNKRPRSSDQP